MRASVHIDLPGWTKLGPKVLAARCEELQLQPRGTRGESGGQTGEELFSLMTPAQGTQVAFSSVFTYDGSSLLFMGAPSRLYVVRVGNL